MELLESDETFYGVIYSDGHVKLQDVSTECIRDKWIPLATYTPLGERTKVILFKCQILAKKFSKRNLPSQWITGAVRLSKDNIRFLIEKNLDLEVFDFPKKMKDNPNIELGFEVLDLQDPDLGYYRPYQLRNL